jgi:hypothetical protein
VQAIFRLVQHNGLRSIKNGGGNFLTSVGGQTVHDNGIGSGDGEQRFI